jgi:hypothetical protein
MLTLSVPDIFQWAKFHYLPVAIYNEYIELLFMAQFAATQFTIMSDGLVMWCRHSGWSPPEFLYILSGSFTSLMIASMAI